MFAFFPEGEGFGVEIGRAGGGHAPHRSAEEFIDHGAAVGSGEDADLRGFLLELGDAGEGDAGFVLDVFYGGDGFGEGDYVFDGYLADGLEDQREAGGGGGDFGEELDEAEGRWGEGDEGVGPVGGGVFGEAEGGLEVVGLDADDELGGFAFTGGEDGFGALEAFGFGERPELAGELGPGEALDAAAIEEDDFFGEGGGVELAAREERRLDDGEDAAEGRGGWRGGEERGE